MPENKTIKEIIPHLKEIVEYDIDDEEKNYEVWLFENNYIDEEEAEIIKASEIPTDRLKPDHIYTHLRIVQDFINSQGE
jgi:hypothetical protein